MTNNNPNQPKEFDAVLGGKNPPPVDGVVLGGIEGVKHRLNNTSVEVKIVALKETINYGEAGLDLAIAALKDPSKLVQSFAYRLLWERQEQKVKQAISKCDPTLLFTTFSNWDIKQFNSQTGINEPFSSAYVVNLEWLELLLESKQPSQVTAISLQISYNSYKPKKIYSYLENILVDVCKYLPNLKALCIESSEILLGDLSLILEAYPYLELLELNIKNNVAFSYLTHENLKTLIISVDNISQICNLKLPALQYLNLHIKELYNERQDLSLLTSVLSCKTFPSLKHLGLYNSSYRVKVADALAKSLLVHRLLSLDLSDNDLEDEIKEVSINSMLENRLRDINMERLRTINIDIDFLF